MGADLFESYVGSMIAAIALGWAMTSAQAFALFGIDELAFPGLQGSLVLYPILLSGLGILASVLGTFAVRTNNEKKIQDALFRGMLVASALVLAGGWVLTRQMGVPMQVYYCVLSGLIAGVAIGKLTEYYTAKDMGPAQQIAKQSLTGPATNIIAGLGVGMMSTGLPVLAICVAIFVSYMWGGVYGVAISGVGMLSTLGISLGVDAYGPVADNAGGIAEMCHAGPEVRQRTDSLDAVGNTTAAIGKGFAIGSAALTALALFATFRATVDTAVTAAGGPEMFRADRLSLSLDNPNVLIGMLIGGMLPFIFSALTMNAVGRSASKMIDEVRRQFREIKGLREGTAEPDSARCVAISTQAAIREMILPGVLAVLSPIAAGYILGVSGLAGLLAGSLVTGVLMALMMANAGGAWDNAKKYIEEGHLGGKGSDAHKAAVTGDTVGDPFKDTSGPSLNILIKLMTVVAVIFAPLVVSWMI
jgi:K(+)-stimulated pyrophosphate-energized sodium pump